VNNHYREWDFITTVPKLELDYYQLKLPDGRKILAMEYPMQTNWVSGQRGVVYFDVPPNNLFSFCTISANQVAGELTQFRQQGPKENIKTKGQP